MNSHKRAFTLIELLVVIAIIAILAAILFPVFAQAKEAAKKTADLSNVKQQGTAIAIYLSDYDDMMPLQAGMGGNGVWGYNYYKYVPADWAAASVPADRKPYSEGFYANTIQPYMKNYDMLVMPGAAEWEYQPTTALAAGKSKKSTSYAYNGFLSSYNATAVVEVTKLPLITGLNGFSSGKGVGFANPALTCPTAFQACIFVPRSSSGCSTANGGTGAVYTNFNNSSYWAYSRGQNYGFVDTHAKFRRVGATLSPGSTDWRTDPLTGYDSTGRAGFYWYDGCHAWLFRPNYDFS